MLMYSTLCEMCVFVRLGTQRDVLAVAMAMNHMSKDICSWIGGNQCHHGDNTSSAQLPPTQAEYECQQVQWTCMRLQRAGSIEGTRRPSPDYFCDQ